jgi:glutathione transport system permease protein
MVVRRLIAMVPVLLIVAALVFSIIHLVPGDPVLAMVGAEAAREDIDLMRARLGLDRPLLVQFGAYIGGLAQGDLGRSIRSGRPVFDEIAARMPRTLTLAVVALGIAVGVGMVLGVIAAVYRGTWIDSLAMLVAIVGVSAPTFWIGLVFILVFAVELRWFPTGGSESWRHVILPAATLGFHYAAVIARVTRSSMLDVLADDYVRTARAKGLAEWVVIVRHALKNALIPTVTIVGLQFGALISGSIVVEVVFSWPGLGLLLITALNSRDYPVVQACILTIATFFILVNLFVDTLYAAIDPRVRYG